MLTVKDILEGYQKKLDYLDIELIISRVIKKSREFVLAHPEYAPSQTQAKKIKQFAKRREKHEPLAYILENKEFYGLYFKVNKHTLIPRPETELLVELAVKNILETKDHKPKTVIDIGTGSGNIIISIANILEKNKNFQFIATDISSQALKVTKINAKVYGLDKKIKFYEGDLLEPILKNKKIIKNNSEIFLIANLPYGWSAWKNNSSSETIGIRFEPPIALFTGKRGLELYEKLLIQLNQLKNLQNLNIFLEIDPRQHDQIIRLIKKVHPAAKVESKKDLARRWRAIMFHF